jgi:cobalt-zinc-cadmium efflux system outer membrane protein
MTRVHAAALAALLLTSAAAPAEPITLPDAIRRATEANAELTALAAELRAAEAATRQAGRRANPEVELSVENAGAEEAATETTLAVGQLVELGGDRRARVDAATAAREIVRLDYEARRRDVEARVRIAFASFAAARQQLAIARENLTSAEEAFGAIRDRVAAGKVSPIEETRAGVTVSMERIELARAEADVQSTRIALASTWGGGAVDLEIVEGTVVSITDAVDASVDAHPELRRAEAVVAQREAETQIERARGVPDLHASAGVRGYEGGDGPAAVAGVAMSLPFFDRNRDAVAAALARTEAARSEVSAARVRLTRDLDEARIRQTAARQNVERFRIEVIPAAQSVYEAISEGYRLGKFGYLEVLDARRTLAGARQQLVAAQRELELARIDVERLTGGWK